jgi:hypothetical protein
MIHPSAATNPPTAWDSWSQTKEGNCIFHIQYFLKGIILLVICKGKVKLPLYLSTINEEGVDVKHHTF